MSTPPSNGREVACTLIIPIGAWHDDPVREDMEKECERQLAEFAAEEGAVLHPLPRSVMVSFQKYEGEGEDLHMVPCVQEQADAVVYRRSAMTTLVTPPDVLPGHIHPGEIVCTNSCPGWVML
jgi:hypothetical protein